MEIDRLILKFKWKLKGPKMAKTTLEKRNKVKELTLPDFKTQGKVKIIKKLWYCCQDRQVE